MRSNRRLSETVQLALLVVVTSSTIGWGAAASQPRNTFIYVLTGLTEASYISQFQVASNGTLRPLNPPAVSAGNYTVSIAVSPDGNYLFALDNPGEPIPGTFLRFSINSDGTLASNPVTSTGPTGSAYPFTLTPDGKFALVPVGNTVMSYSIDASGEFTLVSTITAGRNACTVAIDRTGQFAYVGNFQDHTISEYRIAPDGELTSNGSVSVAPNEIYLFTFSPEVLYSAGCCQLTGLVKYSINPSLGTIFGGTPYRIGHLPYSFAFNPGGTYAYTVNADSSISISSLRVNRATGSLAKNAPDIPITGRGAGQIAVDSSGRFLFLAQPTLQAGVKGTIWLSESTARDSSLRTAQFLWT